jgi:hypothetical protein
VLFERKRIGQNKMRNGISRMGLVLKLLLLAVHELQMGTNDIFPDELKQYFQSLSVIAA